MELDPGAGGVWVGRGLARALTGNLAGARADFEASLAATPSDEEHALRREWAEALRRGENPFTPELLEELRGR